jgi:hypothetical protein
MNYDRSRRCNHNCYMWLYQLITQPRQITPNTASNVLSVSHELQSVPAHTLITFKLYDKARNDQDPVTVTTQNCSVGAPASDLSSVIGYTDSTVLGFPHILHVKDEIRSG